MELHYLEIVTPDVERMCELYSDIHGWVFSPPNPVLGHARVSDIGNGARCGIRAPLQPTERPVIRPYVKVQDLESEVRRVAAQGAKIMLERMVLEDEGVIAIYEMGGIEHGLWQTT